MQDMNLPQLVADFQSEEKCRAYLEALRWRDGVSCPRCASRKISRVLKRGQFDCDSCRYQFSVTAGTIFHDSHLRSEEHTSELQSLAYLVCRLLLEKKYQLYCPAAQMVRRITTSTT